MTYDPVLHPPPPLVSLELNIDNKNLGSEDGAWDCYMRINIYIIESASLLATIDELQSYPKRFTPAKRIIEELGEDGPPVYCCAIREKPRTLTADRFLFKILAADVFTDSDSLTAVLLDYVDR